MVKTCAVKSKTKVKWGVPEQLKFAGLKNISEFTDKWFSAKVARLAQGSTTDVLHRLMLLGVTNTKECGGKDRAGTCPIALGLIALGVPNPLVESGASIHACIGNKEVTCLKSYPKLDNLIVNFDERLDEFMYESD